MTKTPPPQKQATAMITQSSDATVKAAKPQAKPTADPLTCIPHNNEANYIDVAVGGRIRTTCRICKRFIGYRTTK